MKRLLLALTLALMSPCDAFMLRGAPAPVTLSTLSYVAFGDSITFGAQSTKACAPTTPHLISAAAYVGGTSYVCLVSKYINNNVISGIAGSGAGNGFFQDLGIPNNGVQEARCHITATIAASHAWCSTSSATYMDPNATAVTIAVGANDSQNTASKSTGGVFCGSTSAPCSDASFTTQWQADYDGLISEIIATAPNAKITLINIGNLAYINGTGELPDTNTSGQSPDTSCIGAGKLNGSGHNCGMGDRFSRIINAYINGKYSATPNNSTTFNVINWATFANRYNPAYNNDLGSPNALCGTAGTNGIHPCDPGHSAYAGLIEGSLVTPVTPESSVSIGNFGGTVVNAPSGNFSPF